MKIWKISRTCIVLVMVFVLCFIFGSFSSSWILGQCAKQTPSRETVAMSNEVVMDQNGINRTINVLLLAYARSGSSFSGELLTTDDDVFYVYEPSLEYRVRKKIEDAQNIVEILNGIYNCNNDTLEMLGKSGVGKGDIALFYPKVTKVNLENNHTIIDFCKSSRVRVIKTIRLEMEVARQLMFTYPSLNLKIVHLVRDPRAMVNSLKQLSIWSRSTVEKASNCASLRKDLSYSEGIPKESYIRVRYEDLSTKLLETITSVYNRIGLPFTQRLACYILEHTQSGITLRNYLSEEYFSTYKNKDFDPNHWKNSMKLRDIKQIETDCKDVMKELNYEFYDHLK